MIASGRISSGFLWPGGNLQGGVTLTLDGVTTIQDPTAPVGLVGSSVAGNAYPTASSTHRMFTWDTTNRTCPE